MSASDGRIKRSTQTLASVDAERKTIKSDQFLANGSLQINLVALGSLRHQYRKDICLRLILAFCSSVCGYGMSPVLVSVANTKSIFNSLQALQQQPTPRVPFSSHTHTHTQTQLYLVIGTSNTEACEHKAFLLCLSEPYSCQCK